MQGKTVIAIAHRLSTIARMDRLIVLEQAAIVEQGTHAELLRMGGHYESCGATSRAASSPMIRCRAKRRWSSAGRLKVRTSLAISRSIASVLTKVPKSPLRSGSIKILATTLGRNRGVAVTMSMNLGYLDVIFAAIFAVAVSAQIHAGHSMPSCTGR